MILLSMDIQKGITNERLENYADFMANVSALLDKARGSGIEVIHVQHDEGPGTGFSVGDVGYEICDEFKPLPGEKSYRKTELNCFTNPELKEYIAKSGAKTLVIIGLMTNYCVDASVKGAARLGYEVIVPVGANSTSDYFKIGGLTTCRHYNEVEWPEKYARCISVDETLAMMEGYE